MKTIKIFLIAAFVMLGGLLYAQDFKVNTNKTEIKWTGKKVTGGHHGFIKLKEGVLKLKDGNITGGNFIIDMNTITCEDLEDPATNKKLVNHLKSDDFFGVEKYPTAMLEIINATPFEKYSSEVEAKITIKGKTETIKFDVNMVRDMYIATIVIDRSKFDVKFRSGSFFDNLGDKLIYDDFTLNVKLYLE